MSKEESVINLLVEKDKYKKISEEYKETLEHILSRFYCIGGALNDNVLQFNNKQQIFLDKIAKEIEATL